MTALGWFGVPLDPNDYMLNLILPVGISFYTFQTMAYTIDIYRGDIVKPERSFERFALYVSFFPQLVAGPVERAPHLLPQFSRPFRLSPAMVYEGIFLILLGFIKKLLWLTGSHGTSNPILKNWPPTVRLQLQQCCSSPARFMSTFRAIPTLR